MILDKKTEFFSMPNIKQKYGYERVSFRPDGFEHLPQDSQLLCRKFNKKIYPYIRAYAINFEK